MLVPSWRSLRIIYRQEIESGAVRVSVEPPEVKHSWTGAEYPDDDIAGAYALIQMTDGTVYQEIMGRGELDKIASLVQTDQVLGGGKITSHETKICGASSYVDDQRMLRRIDLGSQTQEGIIFAQAHGGQERLGNDQEPVQQMPHNLAKLLLLVVRSSRR